VKIFFHTDVKTKNLKGDRNFDLRQASQIDILLSSTTHLDALPPSIGLFVLLLSCKISEIIFENIKNCFLPYKNALSVFSEGASAL
jgi:hypothetical protein